MCPPRGYSALAPGHFSVSRAKLVEPKPAQDAQGGNGQSLYLGIHYMHFENEGPYDFD